MRSLGFFILFMFGFSCQASVYSELSLSTNYSRNVDKNYTTGEQLELGWDLEYRQSNFDIKFDGNYIYDFVYDSNNNFSQSARDNYQSRALIREAYVGFFALESYWSIGIQKTVWGEADDIQVVDVINPLDFRDFVLFDIDEYKLGIPMLKVDYDISDESSLSFITIFQYQSNQYPPTGSEFSFENYNDVDLDKWGKVEFGLRLNSYYFNSDVSLYSFYGYNDDPVISVDIAGKKSLLIDKYAFLGASISRPIGSWVGRGELAYFKDLLVNSVSPEGSKIDRFQGLLGLDYRYIDWVATFQFTDYHILNYSNALYVNKSEPLYTLSLERELLSGNLVAKGAFSYVSSQGKGSLSQLKMSYRPVSDVKLDLNLDLFTGKQDNIFGQFQKNDRIWISVIYFL